MAISPAKAANIAGVSRTVVSRALTSGELIGVKKNSGHWAIENSDILDWMERTITRAERKPATPAPTPSQIEMEALQTDRDAWQRQAETLASRPTGILAKLFGR